MITLDQYLQVLLVAFISLLANILIIGWLLLRRYKDHPVVQYLKDFMFEDEEEEEEDESASDVSEEIR